MASTVYNTMTFSPHMLQPLFGDAASWRWCPFHGYQLQPKELGRGLLEAASPICTVFLELHPQKEAEYS